MKNLIDEKIINDIKNDISIDEKDSNDVSNKFQIKQNVIDEIKTIEDKDFTKYLIHR